MCFPCRFDSIRSCVSIVEILCFVLFCWRGVRFSYFSCHSQHSQARCASLNTFFASDHVTKFQRKKIHTHAMCNRWSVFDMIYNLKNIFESSFHCCVFRIRSLLSCDMQRLAVDRSCEYCICRGFFVGGVVLRFYCCCCCFFFVNDTRLPLSTAFDRLDT